MSLTKTDGLAQLWALNMASPLATQQLQKKVIFCAKSNAKLTPTTLHASEKPSVLLCNHDPSLSGTINKGHCKEPSPLN